MHICVVLQLCCDSCKCVLVLFRVTYNACYATTFGDEVKVLMAATHGSLSQFDSSLEDWSSYTERLGHYFVANDVDDDRKKRSILLAACGPAAYKLIRSLIEHDSITTTSYADLVKKCTTCQESRPSPPVAPLHPWEWPSQPWSRLHLDFAGPFLGRMFLVLIDSHSKWMDIGKYGSTSYIGMDRKKNGGQ